MTESWASIPPNMKALVMNKAEGKPGHVYHPATIQTVPVPALQDDDVLVQIHAAALNHRDLFIRQMLIHGAPTSSPGITFPSILGADGYGRVVAPASSPLYGKLVILAPSVGWESDPDGPDVPEQEFGILGGVRQTKGKGTFAEYIAVPEDKAIPAPSHLSPAEAAAFPLGGVTAYRAVFTKAKVKAGQNVLITGIGGGVAIQALQFAVAAGAKVWVTSGSPGKIQEAKRLGAQGGLSYKEDKWAAELAQLLPKDRPYLDAVIDSGGGKITQQVARVLKIGGTIACYGSTTGQDMPMTMVNVLRNQVFAGSTMGSHAELLEAVRFIDQHQIHPVVYKTFNGLNEAEKAFDEMTNATQFGKLVLDLISTPSSKL